MLPCTVDQVEIIEKDFPPALPVKMAEYAGKTVVFFTEDDMNAAIQLYEEETLTHFVIGSLSASFSTATELYVNTIRWNLKSSGEGVDIPFDKVPFCWVGRKYLVCQFGKRKTGVKDKDGTRHRRYKTTKKINCPAKVTIKKIIKFPQFKIDGKGCLKIEKTKSKERLMAALRSDSDAVQKDIRYYVKFSSLEDHQGHNMGEEAAKKEPIDQRVMAKLEELSKAGITSHTVLQSQAYRYVETELFKNQQPPPRSRRRYYPNMKDIMNFTARFRRKMEQDAVIMGIVEEEGDDSEMDEEEIKGKGYELNQSGQRSNHDHPHHEQCISEFNLSQDQTQVILDYNHQHKHDNADYQGQCQFNQVSDDQNQVLLDHNPESLEHNMVNQSHNEDSSENCNQEQTTEDIESQSQSSEKERHILVREDEPVCEKHENKVHEQKDSNEEVIHVSSQSSPNKKVVHCSHKESAISTHVLYNEDQQGRSDNGSSADTEHGIINQTQLRQCKEVKGGHSIDLKENMSSENLEVSERELDHEQLVISEDQLVAVLEQVCTTDSTNPIEQHTFLGSESSVSEQVHVTDSSAHESSSEPGGSSGNQHHCAVQSGHVTNHVTLSDQGLITIEEVCTSDSLDQTPVSHQEYIAEHEVNSNHEAGTSECENRQSAQNSDEQEKLLSFMKTVLLNANAQDITITTSSSSVPQNESTISGPTCTPTETEPTNAQSTESQLSTNVSKAKRKVGRIGLVRKMKSIMHQILDYSLLVKDRGLLEKFLGDLEQMNEEASRNACLDPVVVQKELDRNKRKRGSDLEEVDASEKKQRTKQVNVSDVM